MKCTYFSRFVFNLDYNWHFCPLHITLQFQCTQQQQYTVSSGGPKFDRQKSKFIQKPNKPACHYPSTGHQLKGFSGVGLACRWWVEVMSWWGWCRSGLAMILKIAWRVGLLGCLFHWQLVPFFFWIAFCLRLPPWCSLVVDLGQLQCGSENYHSCHTCDNSWKSGKNIYLLIQCPRSRERSEAQVG